MNVLGVAKDRTTFGKVLRNGGAALVRDGEVHCAIAEERITGTKHAPGFLASMHEVLAASNLRLEDIDRIAVSTCCEPESNALDGHPLAGDARLVSVNHHLSHGTFAYHASGFGQALVMVLDGGGNVLTERTDEEWWRHPREQHSYYLADRGSALTLIERDLSGPFEVGFGEMYRAFTYYLGWPSSRHASRLMALAAHGRRDAFKADIYDVHDGQLVSPLKNDPSHPVDMVLSLGDALDVDFGEPRSPGEEILQIHADIAAFVQSQLELTLCRKVEVLRRRCHFDRVCLSGGVALNVLANGYLVEGRICEEIYVPPAPADDGQCVGNALVAALDSSGYDFVSAAMTTSSHAALGPRAVIDSAAVSKALHDTSRTEYTVFENPEIPETMARFLDSGAAVSIFSGRSEFGPRALGQRSILGDPRKPEVRPLFNGIKDREWFMPFAPAVLAEHVSEWFEQNVSSPFMSFAVHVRPEKRHLIPAVVSQDGTARLQTLDPNERSLLREVVEYFEKLTGVPLVLNTSLNTGGKPIVETVHDAIETFSRMALNIMVLGRFVIVKNLSPALADMDVLPAVYRIGNVSVVQHGRRIPLGHGPVWARSNQVASRQIIRRVQEETGAVVFVRHDFPLRGQYLEWLREGRKFTTIRFRMGGVEVPRAEVLPLYATARYEIAERKDPTAAVRVDSIRYQRFGELTEEDAQLDGFESLAEMLAAFREIYPKLGEHDWVTIYDIELV